MQYRKDKYGKDISILGYGCMRFPNKKGKTDMEETDRQIMLAIQNGVNYFDTAYVYSGSEAALGEILEKNHIREKVNIASKLPHYLVRNESAFDRIFSEELKRLRTGYIDYYLVHMLTDVKTWERLVKLGIIEWLAEKKEAGAIRQVGFSYHGNSDEFCRLVDCYDWDFVQIQYNYLDENSQAGRTGLDYAASKGLPVIIMEPLRGGRLVNHLPKEAIKAFESYPVSHTPAQWALRWLWSQEKVTCVLSGMNTEEMILDNVQTASEVKVGEMGDAELQMLSQVVSAINFGMKVPCTGCRYCMPCPAGVDIPGSFAALNRISSDGKIRALTDYFMCTGIRKNSSAASRCVGCGKCETHCPQGIEIRKELKNVTKQLGGPVYRIASGAVRLFKFY